MGISQWGFYINSATLQCALLNISLGLNTIVFPAWCFAWVKQKYRLREMAGIKLPVWVNRCKH